METVQQQQSAEKTHERNDEGQESRGSLLLCREESSSNIQERAALNSPLHVTVFM